MFTEINDAKIAELRSKTRERGLWERELKAFVASDSNGGELELNGKSADTAYQGLRLALNKLDEDVKETIRIVKNEDSVYILRNEV